MNKGIKFGFILGFLAGTAAVEAMGIMTAQGTSTPQMQAFDHTQLVTTQSQDGLTLYLREVNHAKGATRLRSQTSRQPTE